MSFAITIINALVLIGIGLYGYIETSSLTALITPVVGVILLILAFPIKNDNRTAGHIAVILTFLITIALIWRFTKGGNGLILTMLIISVIAMIVYIMGFINRKKQSASL
jgi:uncharacterized membrane protein (UPF0136 family)